MDIARHVIGCQLTQDTMVYNVDDDVAGIICQALGNGVPYHRGVSIPVHVARPRSDLGRYRVPVLAPHPPHVRPLFLSQMASYSGARHVIYHMLDPPLLN